MPVRYRGHRMSSPFSLGDIVNGRYRLTAHIISSPTADVFRADDLSLTRPVAIHVAPHSLANDSQFLQSFRDEATAVAALNHPHILRVYDWGEEAGGAYLVTEFPVGGTLRTVLDRDGQMDETKAALMGLEIADGLAYAHARGMVHGALSPETIHFDIDGRAKIADFGFTTAIANSHIGPSTDIRYASPEQAQRQPTDGRTDVYSLSLIIFEAITGTIPHAQATPAETLTARIGAPLPSDPRIKSLDMVLAQAGAYDAKFRLDAATMTTRLHSIVGTMPSVPTFASTMPPPPPVAIPTESVREVKRPQLGFQAPTSQDVLSHDTAPQPASTLIEGIESALQSGEVPMSNSPVRPTASRGSRRWLRAALGGVLVVVTLGLVGAYALGVFKPSHTVPSVVGLNQAQALKVVSESNFTLKITGHSFSTTVADGLIASQTPVVGGSLQEGGTISVTLSKGAAPVPIPTNIIGMDCASATRALSSVGIVASCPSSAAVRSSTVAKDHVVRVSFETQTNPASVPHGAHVTLVLSLGASGSTTTTTTKPGGSTTTTTTPPSGQQPRAVPDVTGKSPAQVKALLSAAGFYYQPFGPDYVPNKWKTVLAQNPAPGNMLKWHGTVYLRVK